MSNNPPGSNAGAGQSNPASGLLPGERGKDYHFVKAPNGATYVVYSVDIGGGRTVHMSWRIDKDQLDALGAQSAARVTKQQFSQMQVFGSSEDITRTGDTSHPWQSFLKDLHADYGDVTWLRDAGYMKTMLEGWFEQMDSSELAQRLTQTHWYQSRTVAQRQWETTGKAEKRSIIDNLSAKIHDTLQGLWGDASQMPAGFASKEQVNAWATKIAAGAWGNPTDGFNAWAQRMQKQIANVSGTQAWMDKQSGIQSLNEFKNKPEMMYEQLKNDSFKWLGYAAENKPYLSQATLKQWSTDVVSGVKSLADWDKFMQQQSAAMYPYLGSSQSWQDFVQPYKASAEQLLGKPIDWSSKYLQNLGVTNDQGDATGNPLSFDAYGKQIRSTDEFWRGSVARDQASSMVAHLSNIFEGVNY